jgi:hypothetical protein
VAVSVGVDVFGGSVTVAVASGDFVGSVLAVLIPPIFIVGEGTPGGYGCPEPCAGCGKGDDISTEGCGYACSVAVGRRGIVEKG